MNFTASDLEEALAVVSGDASTRDQQKTSSACNRLVQHLCGVPCKQDSRYVNWLCSAIKALLALAAETRNQAQLYILAEGALNKLVRHSQSSRCIGGLTTMLQDEASTSESGRVVALIASLLLRLSRCVRSAVFDRPLNEWFIPILSRLLVHEDDIKVNEKLGILITETVVGCAHRLYWVDRLGLLDITLSKLTSGHRSVVEASSKALQLLCSLPVPPNDPTTLDDTPDDFDLLHDFVHVACHISASFGRLNRRGLSIASASDDDKDAAPPLAPGSPLQLAHVNALLQVVDLDSHRRMILYIDHDTIYRP